MAPIKAHKDHVSSAVSSFRCRHSPFLTCLHTVNNNPTMATPIVLGVGAIAAGLVGRQLFRSGVIGGKKAAEEWAKGGFRAKMDRKEAIAILGLKCVNTY